MKRIIVIPLVMLLSCGQKNSRQEKSAEDTTMQKHIIVDTLPSQIADTVNKTSDLRSKLTPLIQTQYKGEWQIVNDSLAAWPKDEFDYFIANKRKEDPEYPYACKGDFDADGKEDAAALLKKTNAKQYQLSIISDYLSPAPSFNHYTEDIDVCAISTYPKGDLEGINGEKVKMKGDGIGVEYFEKSSFVVYWAGKNYKRVWTGD